MLKEGKLHCKSIKWFAEYEDGKLRGDEFEAVVKMQYMENTVIQLKETNNPNAQWKNLQVKTGLYKEYYKEPLGNLFCMSLFPADEGVFEIHPRLKEFDDSFLIIHNQVEFFSRIDFALNDLGTDYCHGDVEYLNLHTHSGEKKLYQKDNEYSFQQEHRIHIHRDFTDTFEFFIGGIEDIACLCNYQEADHIEIRKEFGSYQCRPGKSLDR